jgi:hypothetical protein
MLINHTFLNILIFHPKHATHYTIFWNYPWYIWTYSKVLKSTKTDIFNIQLVLIYKTTYIFCNSIICKNNNFSVSRILLGCIGLLTWTSPRILVTWTYIGESIEVSNPDTILQILMTSDYAIKLYTLWRIYYPRAHTSHHPCLCLVKYHKLLLGYHLG